ncbi:Protein of unknown function DUF3445 [Penicillium griseofulvum]|uniref:Uncharacterized protein n=1 Tax=Penicillium patulum TaxID=5078 RepID=A0A135LD61_PENPA|nr:Protein of unknown function DUF3445 [Penicillium griseofulvum]KXG46905.1 Protein of unknown function DUF3445 [Penicillium griseofulvum]
MAWYSILPSELTHLESWVARIFFFLGLITIGPWAFLVLLDATIYVYRLILWEVPYIGGRARGRQRPRAPSLNERPGGRRRAFGLRGVETDTGDSEGQDRDDSTGSERETLMTMEEALYKLEIGAPWPIFSRHLLCVIFVGLFGVMWKIRQFHKATAYERYKTTCLDNKGLSITPLEKFNWEETEPLQLRPFQGKDKYNLTMALENLDPSELIPMDKTYKSRLAQRKSVLDQHHDIVVAINNDQTPKEDPRIRPAISELYNFVLETYLPTRYPSMFRLSAESSLFQNLVTGATWPTRLSPTTPTTKALEILAQTVDEDFLILLPDLSPDTEEQPRYVLQAYATCFPAGFNTREKLGLRLADIHGPVPRYQERIGRSMDKFFARIEVGKFVKRFNWSITIDTGLFAAFGGTHAVSGVKEDAIEVGKLNIDQTVLRCERQTLHRLPVSKALVFFVHTYVYPVRQIKDEGSGEDLANAIDGLKRGNVPEIHTYKKGDVWGEALKDFLRA